MGKLNSMNSSAPAPKVLFFDVAGTLLHTAEPVGDTYARVAARHGVTFDAVQLHQGFKTAFAGMGSRDDETVPNHGDDRNWWREIVRRALASQSLPPTFPFDDYFEELYLHFAKPEAWTPFPDVVPALDHLRSQGYRLAVLSNLDSRLRPVLAGLGLESYFEKLFISAELGAAKPSPTIYRLALRGMDCAPEAAWMIGDEHGNDIAAPRSLGMGTYRVDRPGSDLAGLSILLNSHRS